MNRWWMVGVAAVAVVLAFLLLRPPETGPVAPTPPSPTGGAAPVPRPSPVADDAEKVGPTGVGEIDAPPEPGSVADQLANPATPDDVKRAAAVSGEWSRLARRLAYGKDAPPAWAAVEGEAAVLADKIKAFRDDPTSGDWAALVAEQQALIPRIRAAEPDADLTATLDAIEAKLAGSG